MRKASLSSVVLGAAVIVCVVGSGAMAQSGPFAKFQGAWSGSGQIRLDGDKMEQVKCKAYYTDKEKGSGLGLALRCASASNSIDLRANLVSTGSAVTGSWEERQFNASGNVTGQMTGQKLNLAIAGSGFSGSMAVTTSGSNQTVAIVANGVAFKGVNIALNKD